MRKFLLRIVIAVSLFTAIFAVGINIYAAENPYTLTAFIKCADYDRKGQNEYHPDDIILQRNGYYSLGNIEGTFDGAWLMYNTYSFGKKGTEKIRITYCVNSLRCAPDSRIEVWTDGYTVKTGTRVATISLSATGTSWDKYITKESKLDKKITGDHTVFFVLRGTTSVNVPFVANLGSFSFVDPDPPPSPSPVKTTQTPTPTPTKASTPTPVKTTPPATTEYVTEQATTLPPTPTETTVLTETVLNTVTPEITVIESNHQAGKGNIIVYVSSATGIAVLAGVLRFYIIKRKNK